jgi:hypothetical protein
MKIHQPELTQDDINRMQLEIGFRNSGQSKYVANVAAAVIIAWVAVHYILNYLVYYPC